MPSDVSHNLHKYPAAPRGVSSKKLLNEKAYYAQDNIEAMTKKLNAMNSLLKKYRESFDLEVEVGVDAARAKNYTDIINVIQECIDLTNRLLKTHRNLYYKHKKHLESTECQKVLSDFAAMSTDTDSRINRIKVELEKA